MNNNFLPIFLKVDNEKALVVGGGDVAFRKTCWLLEYNLKVDIVSICFNEKFDTILQNDNVCLLHQDVFQIEFSQYRLIIAATNDARINQKIAHDANAHNIPINVVDNPALCTFITPSTLKRGPLSVAVSSSGNSPSLSARIRREIGGLYPQGLDDFTQALGVMKKELKKNIGSKLKRVHILRFLASREMEHKVVGLDFDDILVEMRSQAACFIRNDVATSGKVFLVGSGPGDPGLLTIKGFQCIFMADVIIYDGLVNKTLLDLKNENAVLVDGSKRAGKGCREQESINEMMLRHAAAGKIVCRLKGGDPFVFGRGGEEALFLKNNNVSFEIVSGVTSAVAALAYAGIPITHRDHCSNFQVITGHENPLKTDSRLSWKNLAQNMGTLVFLMSSARLTDISNRLIEHGKLASTPVALISKGTLPDQTVVITTLKEAASGTNIHLEGVRRPALFVVGDVVKLREELNWFH